MRITDTSDLWWKTAVVYCLDVETFLDWNDDGIGDFEGLAHRMDYLHELGVTCLWLMPFYPTPDRDDGYDITDFYGVDPRLGNHGDFVEMMRMARDRGMRVIIDLVVNHTSDQHPWFVEARKSQGQPVPRLLRLARQAAARKQEPVFPDEEDSVWELDEKTGQYYLHRFYKFQPDLNVTNPKVRDEIAKIMGFWLRARCHRFSGRRRAVPDRPGRARSETPATSTNPLDFLKSMRAFLGRRSRRRDHARRGQPAAQGPGRLLRRRRRRRLTMQFDFIAMQNLYLSLARQDPAPLVEALRVAAEDRRRSRSGPTSCATTTSSPSTSSPTTERQEVFAAFGPEPSMQVFDRGIIRRLPPMLDGDPRRIRMVYSLMFSLPGTPVLFYGEEIGMGEHLRHRRPHRGAHADAVDGRQERRLLQRAGSAGSREPRGR